MKKIPLVIIFLLFPILSSCTATHYQNDIANTRELWPVEKDKEVNMYVKSGRFIDLNNLKRGGNLLVLPFKAGNGIEVNAKMDKVALMTVRGIVDVFEKKREDECACAEKEETNEEKLYNDIFDLVISNQDELADFVIDGYIQQATSSGKMANIVGRNKKYLEIRGVIMDKRTGKTVAVFSDYQLVNERDTDLKDLGRQIGRNIALFILKGVKD